MSKNMIRGLAATLLVASTAVVPAQAATVLFSDDFNSITTSALDTPPVNWTTDAGGTVDRIKSGDYSINCLGNTGGCVDLDGTAGGAGLLSTGNFVLQAGGTYLLSAMVSGNQRNDTTDSLVFGLRDAANSATIYAQQSVVNILGGDTNNTFSPISLLFTVGNAPLTVRIFFQAGGNDNIGPILENVSLAAVPLPAAAWLLLSGLVGFAALGRRKVAA